MSIGNTLSIITLSILLISPTTFAVNNSQKTIDSSNQKIVTQISREIEIPAGSDYYVKFSSENLSLEEAEFEPYSSGLTDKVKLAIAKSPNWIQRKLTRQFHSLENPEEYAKARKNNLKKIKTPEREAKRKASFEKWVKKNPEKYKAWQKKLITSRTSKEANEKRKASIKKFNKKHPQKAKANAQKRAKAATAKTSKEVCMIDLQSGKVLKVFPSQHAAARWLVENGKAKNMNCVSSISAVCKRKPCTSGYGYRKKAYGYDWRFTSEIEPKK